MHINGIMIDVSQVKNIADMCKQKIDDAKIKLDYLMDGVNLDSPKQLREFFVNKKHLRTYKLSKRTDEPSVDSEVLKRYAEEGSQEAKLLLQYRKYEKILSTFIPALTPKNWNIENCRGKVYPSFNQAGTVSGRFSSSNPNFQNIPRGENLGLRKCIVADEGHILVGFDYSQIELKIAAHLSQDFHLMKAYNEKVDIHQQTADSCGCTRTQAKIVEYGLLYGAGTKTMSKNIGVSYEEAKQFMERFWITYPRLKQYVKDIQELILKQGYVETELGRKRRLTNYFHAKDSFDQGREIRSLINFTIQGLCADVLKIAMISMYSQLKKHGARIIVTCHDEILVSTPKDKVQQIYAIVHRAMIEAGQFITVPVSVDGGIGNDWSQTH